MLHCLPSSAKDESPCSVSRAHSGMVTSVDAICLEGISLVVSGGTDYAVVVYRVVNQSLAVLWRDDTQGSIVTGVLFGVGIGTGTLYVTNQSGIVQIWDVVKIAKIGEIQHHTSRIVGVCQSQDGRFVVTAATDRKVLVYDVSKGMKCVNRIESDDVPSTVAFFDGKVVCGYCSGDIRLWRVHE